MKTNEDFNTSMLGELRRLENAAGQREPSMAMAAVRVEPTPPLVQPESSRVVWRRSSGAGNYRRPVDCH